MSPKLEALFSAGSADEYLKLVNESGDQFAEGRLQVDSDSDLFTIPGYCLPCGREVDFRVDYLAGGSRASGPNWRERLICPHCHMSNRQRLVASLVRDELDRSMTAKRLYLMEQITPVTRFFQRSETEHEVIGAEYFGPDFEPGQNIWPWHYLVAPDASRPIRSLVNAMRFAFRMLQAGGFRHEDIGNLSFTDSSIDLIVSNDVFEHVSDPQLAFEECARVLKSGGKLIATFPFSAQLKNSRIRARVVAGKLEHLLPAEYHGDPTSSKGALVFTDLGADIVSMFKKAGFSDIQIRVYHNPGLGHVGVYPVFVLTRG